MHVHFDYFKIYKHGYKLLIYKSKEWVNSHSVYLKHTAPSERGDLAVSDRAPPNSYVKHPRAAWVGDKQRHPSTHTDIKYDGKNDAGLFVNTIKADFRE